MPSLPLCNGADDHIECDEEKINKNRNGAHQSIVFGRRAIRLCRQEANIIPNQFTFLFVFFSSSAAARSRHRPATDYYGMTSIMFSRQFRSLASVEFASRTFHSNICSDSTFHFCAEETRSSNEFNMFMCARAPSVFLLLFYFARFICITVGVDKIQIVNVKKKK